MGDMAEYLMDSAFVEEEDDGAVAGINCKYCKTGPYWWQQDHLGYWRLYDENFKLHKCNKYTKNTGD